MNLFAYGTLGFPEILQALTDQHFDTEPASLKDYVCLQVEKEVYPALKPKLGAVTTGLLYKGLDLREFNILDAFEGRIYQRTCVEIETEQESNIPAETYVVDPESAHRLTEKIWDRDAFDQNDKEKFLKICGMFGASFRD